MSKVTKAEMAILNRFPKFTKQDLTEINDLFYHYIFFDNVKGGRNLWTSCCHKAQIYYPELQRIETAAHYEFITAGHDDKVICPFCGRKATMKHKGKARKCQNLEEFIPFILIHTRKKGQEIFVQSYWARKHFYGNYAAKPHFSDCSMYYYKSGTAIQFWKTWDGWNINQDWHTEPFSSGYSSEPYYVIGFDRLAESFIKYTDYFSVRQYNRKINALCRYLQVAAKWPRQVEMLEKMGMNAFVDEWVYNRKKNTYVLNWNEPDPLRAFGLTKPELREFLQTDRRTEYLHIYKALGKKGFKATFAEIAEWYTITSRQCWQNYIIQLTRKSVKYGIHPRRLIRYLSGQKEHQSFYDTYMYWNDYITAADKIGYDMTVERVIMPRDLTTAHDAATAEAARRQGEFNAAQEVALYHKLCKRYAFSDGEYLIRPPRDSKEIISEGKAQKHCVGMYADDHMTGKKYILFLRRISAPDKPLVTIAMTGNRISEVRGYNNDRNAKPAREAYAKILDPWLAWLEKGSKRDKAGNPITKTKAQKRVMKKAG